MTANIEAIKDRIRKLLKTAKDDAATEGEIDNAIRFARSLLDKHHLSEEELADEPANHYARVDAADKSRFFATVSSRFYSWESALARFISNLTGAPSYCESNTRTARSADGRAKLNESDEPYEGKSFAFYGVAEDARMAVDLFYEIWWTVRSMARLKFGQCYRGDGGMYAEGFVDGLSDKLEEQQGQEKKEAISSNNTRGLILIERRNDLIQYKEQSARTWLKGIGVNLYAGSRRSGANGSFGAYGEGRTDGQRTNVKKFTTPKLGHK